jgi:hypothetical protein
MSEAADPAPVGKFPPVTFPDRATKRLPRSTLLEMRVSA